MGGLQGGNLIELRGWWEFDRRITVLKFEICKAFCTRTKDIKDRFQTVRHGIGGSMKQALIYPGLDGRRLGKVKEEVIQRLPRYRHAAGFINPCPAPPEGESAPIPCCWVGFAHIEAARVDVGKPEASRAEAGDQKKREV